MNDAFADLLARCLPPEVFDTDTISLLTQRAHFLLAAAGHLTDVHPSPATDDLAPVLARMAKEDLITPRFVAAMLASGTDDLIVDILAGHVLAAALTELRKGLPPSTSRSGCLEVRSLYQNKRARLRDSLPDFSGQEAADIRDWLEEARTGANATQDSKLRGQLDRLYYLFARHVTGRAHTRSRERRRHTEDAAPHVETDSTASIHSFFDDQDESSIDSAAAWGDIGPAKATDRGYSRPLRNRQARVVASQIIKGYMMSPCTWGVVSERSLATLIRELRLGVAQGNPVDALLTVSLLTGRSVEVLRELPLDRAPSTESDPPDSSHRRRNAERLFHDEDRIALRTGLLLPRPSVGTTAAKPSDYRKQYGVYFEKAARTVYLPLPCELLPCLRARGQQGITDAAISARFAELSQNRAITPARLRSAGHRWLYGSGFDRTVLNRLFDAPLARAVPLHYENMLEERILVAYEAWYNHLNTHLRTQPLTFRRSLREARVGSRRMPTERVVKNLFRMYFDWLDAQLRKTGDTAWGLLDKHNHYALYTYLVLSFATAQRPVRQSFESFRDFCEETSTFFIQDKDSPGHPTPRFVPAPPLAAEQLQHYRQYLTYLRKRLGGNRRQQRYVDAAIAGDAPFLFVFEDGAQRDPEPLSPGELDRLLADIAPLHLGWPRHFLRTHLIGRGVHDEVMQAFLGHGEMGQEPMARYSGLSMADLQDAAARVGQLAHDLGIRPLPHPGLPGAPVTLHRKALSGYDFTEQRKRRSENKRARADDASKRGREWAEAKLREVAQRVEQDIGLLRRDEERAAELPREVLTELDNNLKGKDEWLAARRRVAEGFESINDRFGLAIPVPPHPQPLQRDSLMRNETMFRAHRSVHKAARSLAAVLDQAHKDTSLIDQHLLPLVLFSAACNGALAVPKALLALGQDLSQHQVRISSVVKDRRPLCWLEVRFPPGRPGKARASGEDTIMRRFFLDGITLALLVRYLRQGMASHRSPYEDELALMRDIRTAVKEVCDGDNVLSSLSLNQFCRAAPTVAEHQPGVRLPHYLVEYAHGLIESVSLPDRYFVAMLGRDQAARFHQETPEPTTATVPDTTAAPDPGLDRDCKAISRLYADLQQRKSARRDEVLRRMREFRAGKASTAAKLFVDWLEHLLVDRRLETMTPQRYASPLARGWLVQFQGLDLRRLTSDDWLEAYGDLIEDEPDRRRPFVAGRLADLHRFLSEYKEFPPLPSDFARGYEGVQSVRATMIPERHFSAFVERLFDSKIGRAEQQVIRWLFTLCYRLGTRIGETSRIRWCDIEFGHENPVLRLQANDYGNIKSRRPHQIPFDPFLPTDEREHFHEWLAGRRGLAKGDRELVFAPPRAPGVPWDTRSLGRLFSQLMFEATGLDYSPHACRHSAASRLLLVAENELHADDAPYTRDELQTLRDTAFTASPNCRDRIWHLSAILNHASPQTTFRSYIHTADLLLYTKISKSQRRLAPTALRALLEIPAPRFTNSKSCNADGFLIEKLLPIVHASYTDLFDDLGEPAKDSDPSPQDGPPERVSMDFGATTRAVAFDRFEMGQAALEDLEEGLEHHLVALRYGVREPWVDALKASASALGELRTSRGESRLFGRERWNANARPLAPTRAREAEDQELIRSLVPELRDNYAGREDAFRACCVHWRGSISTARTELRFRTPDELSRFLVPFADGAAKAISARHRWLVRVRPIATKDPAAQRKAWRVTKGLQVEMEEREPTRAPRYPDGIAYLHLVRKNYRRKKAKIDSSKAFRYIMHMLSILLWTHDMVMADGAVPAKN